MYSYQFSKAKRMGEEEGWLEYYLPRRGLMGPFTLEAVICGVLLQLSTYCPALTMLLSDLGPSTT